MNRRSKRRARVPTLCGAIKFRDQSEGELDPPHADVMARRGSAAGGQRRVPPARARERAGSRARVRAREEGGGRCAGGREALLWRDVRAAARPGWRHTRPSGRARRRGRGRGRGRRRRRLEGAWAPARSPARHGRAPRREMGSRRAADPFYLVREEIASEVRAAQASFARHAALARDATARAAAERQTLARELETQCASAEWQLEVRRSRRCARPCSRAQRLESACGALTRTHAHVRARAHARARTLVRVCAHTCTHAHALRRSWARPWTPWSASRLASALTRRRRRRGGDGCKSSASPSRS